MSQFEAANSLLRQFKGDQYLNGIDILPTLGAHVARLGKRVALVRDVFPGSNVFVKTIKDSLRTAGIEIVAELDGAAPNAPREDLARIAAGLTQVAYDVVVSFGGGSTIDATKAAEVIRMLGGTIENYFGTGLVTQVLAMSGKN